MRDIAGNIFPVKKFANFRISHDFLTSGYIRSTDLGRFLKKIPKSTRCTSKKITRNSKIIDFFHRKIFPAISRILILKMLVFHRKPFLASWWTKFSKKLQFSKQKSMEIIDFEQNLDQKSLIFDRISLKNHELACFDR